MSGWNKYKRKLSDMLPCQKKERNHYCEEVRQSLGNNYKDLRYEEVLEKLGPPEELAASYIQGMDAREMAKAMTKRNRLFRLLAVLVGCVILIWAIGVTVAFFDAKAHPSGRLVEGPATTIQSETIPR